MYVGTSYLGNCHNFLIDDGSRYFCNYAIKPEDYVILCIVYGPKPPGHGE